jgi:hypothetical protein
MVSPESART